MPLDSSGSWMSMGDASDPSLAGFDEGGSVRGGHGGTDDIHAMLTEGEFVMPKDKTRKWLPFLESIRRGSLDSVQSIASPRRLGIPRFAEGGLVGGGGGGSAAA